MFPVEHAVVSHAHGDHASPEQRNVYCTAPTAAVMRMRFKHNGAGSYYEHAYRQPFFLGSVKVSFYSAGHILGSAMILMEFEGVRYLYTGDYKLQRDPTCDPIELVNADVLITESTFATPETAHPDPEKEIRKLNETPYSVLLGVYSLGKAQRINALINSFCPHRNVLVHRSIENIHKIYEQFGIDFLRYQAYDRRTLRNSPKGIVYLVPPLVFSNFDRKKTMVHAFASGWERLQRGNTLSLYISDHVDWQDILYSIEQIKPREIWTLHGDGRELYRYFNGKIPVRILNE